MESASPNISPQGDDVENFRPENEQKQGFPIVGIGASAGGVPALRNFFEHLPDEPGMAFLVVLHLSPDHESSLADILRNHTPMPVQTATDDCAIERDNVYVIPSQREMSVDGDRIRLSSRSTEHRPHTIDALFRSLAEEQGDHSVGIVLSGTAADGTLGLRDIKTRGGIAMVQQPDDAQYEEMPRNALDTGVIDLVLPVEELAKRLVVYYQNARSVHLPQTQDTLPPDQRTTLQKIFSELQARTGQDFSHYKRSTVLRRLERRLHVTNTETLTEYLRVLRDRPGEARALFKELLISVTRFFRSPDDFEALEETVLPSLFEDKSSDDEVRVWVAGCATGEEAYSLAMLLHEQADSLKTPPNLQVFATDVDAEALTTARHGVYPGTIEADVTDDRLARFFRQEDGQYRVVPSLRNSVVFAEHNLVGDPPFSNLALICCRNLLIYLDQAMQQRVIRLFRYALNPRGYLFLGPSEAVGTAQSYFSAVGDTRSILKLDGAQSTEQRRVPLFSASGVSSTLSSQSPPQASEPDLEAIHRHLLARQVASIVVDENYEIVHLTEGATDFLRYESGQPSHNLLEKVPPALRLELRSALYQAFQKGKDTNRRVPFSLPGSSTKDIQLSVQPIDDVDTGRSLVQVRLKEARPTLPTSDGDGRPPDDHGTPSEREQDLEEELQDTKQQLRTTAEEYETVTEEMETANEELMSMNEELQAKNEELQTSKEQLQSVNEELKSTNQEFEAKVDALNQANNDLENLMEATEVAVLFVDLEMQIRRFTPPITDIFSLKDSDVGRPITDFTPKLDYDGLTENIEQVLDAHDSIEHEIRGDDDSWYLLRLRPYRTMAGEVDGVVLTFVDITAQKQANEKLREERDLISALIDTAGALIVVLDTDGCIRRFNTASEHLTGYSASAAEGEDVRDLLVTPDDRDDVTTHLDALAEGATDRADFEMRWVSKDEAERLITGSLTALRDEEDHLRYFILTGTDITELRELQREVVDISEQERLRIGQDLHDIVSSGLTGIMMRTESLAHKLGKGEATVEVEDLKTISSKIKKAGEQIRALSHTLVPQSLRKEDLATALASLAEEEADLSDIECEFVGNPNETRPEDETAALNAYRIAHEAVANARKHGDPSHIWIDLQEEGSKLVLTVRDDGEGWEGDVPSGDGLGLYLMRHRADLLGASLTFDRQDGETKVECRIPLD